MEGYVSLEFASTGNYVVSDYWLCLPVEDGSYLGQNINEPEANLGNAIQRRFDRQEKLQIINSLSRKENRREYDDYALLLPELESDHVWYPWVFFCN